MIPAQLKSRGPCTILGVIVAIITLAIASNAVQSIAVPNVSYITYNLAPGADSADITVPVKDSPVLVIANCTVVGRRGVAQLTLHRTAVAPLFLQWVGLDSPAGPSIVGDWWPGGSNPHMCWIDFAHQVELRVVSD